MKRVFVVEDEAIVALELKDHLRMLGYEVCGHAARGDAALRQIPGAHPDLVLMDINLGEGISGLDVAERLKAIIDVPVIFLTAYSDAELTERAVRSESFAYLVKPFDPLVLRANIELALVRHDATMALRQSEAFSLAVLDSLTDHIAVLDELGVVIAVNTAWRRFAERNGAPPIAESFLGANYFAACEQATGQPFGEEAATALAGIRAVLDGKQADFVLEYPCHSPNEQRWFRMHVVPLRGARPGVVIAHENITERKRVKDELRRSERRLNEAQRLAGLGSWEWDIVANTSIWSANLYDIFGITPDWFEPGRSVAFAGLLHPDDQARVTQTLQVAQETNQPFAIRYRIVRPDGVERHLEDVGEFVVDRDGRPVWMRGNSQDITDRARADTALRASEERHRSIFEEAIEGIFRTAVDGTILTVNPAFAQMLGYDSPDELIGTSILALYTEPNDRLRMQERYADSAMVARVDVTWRQKDGNLLLVQINGRAIYDERGQLSHFQGFVHDVTAQHQYAAALHELSTGFSHISGNAFFDEVAERLAAIVDAEISFVGTLLPGPEAHIRTLGFLVDGEIVPSIEYALRGTPCEEVLSGGVAVFPESVQRLFPEDQALCSLRVEGYIAAPMFDAVGKVIGHVGIMTRKPIRHPERVESIVTLFALRAAAEVERQRGEARFVGVFEFAPDALIIVNEAGRIVLANRLAEQTFGYSRDELLCLTVEELVPTADRHEHAVLRHGFSGQRHPRRMGSARSRLWALRKDGTRVPVEISLSPFHSEEGTLVVAAVRDVSERARVEKERALLEDQLRQARRMESLGTLAGGIAHDFNNLLAVIIGNVELARLDVSAADPITKSLDAVATASVRASELVRQILAFSRQQPVSYSITSLGAVVNEVVALLRSTLPAGIQLVTRADGEVPNVRIDPSQIHQVLMNLGTNAWHSIERGFGTITFHLDAVSVAADAPPVAGMGPGRYARITVSDDGMGMDAATIERIFEPFFTTKDVGSGTGLGLAVVHGIIAEHGGFVSVDSAVGRGTMFSVYVPEAAGQVSTSDSPHPPKRIGSGRVLLIEDEEPVLRIAMRLVEHFGYQVTGFLRAVDALDAVRANPGRFDVVITDQNMPEMGGFEVALAIGEIRSDLPIVLSSGNPGQSDAGLAALNIGYRLDKPWTGATLSEVLARALKRG